MRTPFPLAASLAAAVLALSACASDPEPTQPTSAAQPSSTAAPDDAAASSASVVGVVEPPSADGYLCRYVSPSAQKGVTGAAWAQPQQVVVQDDTATWACEARDGDEPLIRLAISRGAEQAAEHREAAQDAGLEQGGPAYLGEAYLAPREITALTMCTARDGSGSTGYEPYSIVVEALAEGTDDVERDLMTAATAMARTLDQSVGCSPKMAADRAAEAGGSTSAP